MADTPQTISVQNLSQWDVIGIHSIPSKLARYVVATSEKPMETFKIAADAKPSMRGMVYQLFYDAQHQDKIIGVGVMMIAPFPKRERVENGDKNLMINEARRLKDMGLSTDRNWRLNYTPIYLETGRPHFGTMTGTAMKFGNAEMLIPLLSGYTDKLASEGKLASMAVLDRVTISRTGVQTVNYDRLSDRARKPKAAMLTDEDVFAAAALERSLRAEKKKNADAETSVKEKAQKSTPSGRLAWKNQARMNDVAKSDLSLTEAVNLHLITKGQQAVYALLGEQLRAPTLRTIFDKFASHHEQVLNVLVSLGECTEDTRIEHKAKLEAKLELALTRYFRTMQSGEGQHLKNKASFKESSIPYKSEPVLKK